MAEKLNEAGETWDDDYGLDPHNATDDDVELPAGGLLGGIHALFHGSDLGCAYGGMSCPQRVALERKLSKADTRATVAAPLESYKYGPTEAALRNQAENIIFTVFPPVRNIHTDSALAELRQLITLALITAYRCGAPEPPDLAAEAELRLRAVACAARDFIWEPENWEAWQDAKESNSVAWPPEFLMLAQAVEKKFGPMPIDDDDKEPANET